MSRPTRTTLVTGSASGMGAAVARYLCARGERVIGVDLHDADIVADLSTATGRAQAVAEVQARCADGLDALVACAGVASDNGATVVSVNYFGCKSLVESLLPLLHQGRHPRAVVVTSSATILPCDEVLLRLCEENDEQGARTAATGKETAYSTSKRALSRWVRRTAIEPGWVDRGVLLNAVAPGLVRTAMTAPLLATEAGQAILRESAPFATAQPAEAEDIAPLLAFLASEENRYMVGQVVFCDGGKDVMMRGDGIF